MVATGGGGEDGGAGPDQEWVGGTAAGFYHPPTFVLALRHRLHDANIFPRRCGHMLWSVPLLQPSPFLYAPFLSEAGFGFLSLGVFALSAAATARSGAARPLGASTHARDSSHGALDHARVQFALCKLI